VEAAERADARGDFNAKANLLRRAAALAGDDVSSTPLRLELARTLFNLGETAEGDALARGVREAAAAAGDHGLALLARRALAVDAFWRGVEGAASELEVIAREAIAFFEAAGDQRALADAWGAVAIVAWGRCRVGEALAARQRMVELARATGNVHFERQALTEISPCLYIGPAPPGELLAWLDEHPWLAQMRPGQAGYQASALAMLGRFDEARLVAGQCEERARELGDRASIAGAAITRGELELLAGDVVAAELYYRSGCEMFEQLGQLGILSTYVTLWARTLWLLGRDDDAMVQTERSEELGASDDVITQVAWRQERARVLARRGEHAAARRLIDDAVAFVERTDMLWARAEAFEALADVLELTADSGGAASALERAQAEFEQKGIIPAIERTRARLTALRAPA
jgi:tetratricopeptide (TPR) repeat protein